MTKVLYFEGAGMDFYEEAQKCSDVGNFRIRTAFTNLDGKQYYIELGNACRHGYKGKSRKLTKLSDWALRIDHLFNLADRGNESYEMNRDWKAIRELDYTKANITAWINTELNCNFETIEVIDRFYGYYVHADGGGYNLMDHIELDHERARKRKEAYNKVDKEYRTLLNERYSVIGVKSMDAEGITIRCHSSDLRLEAVHLPRERRIEIK